MKGKTSFRNDDEAVSPVIGVILMVAITVILAAVIGTFVLNLGGSVQENVQAGASVAVNNEEVRVTWTSNQNADSLTVNIDCSGTTTTSMTNVGQSRTVDCTGQTEAGVIVIAEQDGAEGTVIVDKTVDL